MDPIQRSGSGDPGAHAPWCPPNGPWVCGLPSWSEPGGLSSLARRACHWVGSAHESCAILLGRETLCLHCKKAPRSSTLCLHYKNVPTSMSLSWHSTLSPTFHLQQGLCLCGQISPRLLWFLSLYSCQNHPCPRRQEVYTIYYFLWVYND